MTAFLSTFVNKVDRKGRVSVPAPYRTALAGSSYQGIIAYPSLTQPAAEAFSRDVLNQMNEQRLSRSLEGGEFERLLLGGGDGLVETIMSMVYEMPFDGEGRVVLAQPLIEHAGITDQAVFVGRGNRFQIWAPAAFEDHQGRAVQALRERLAAEAGR